MKITVNYDKTIQELQKEFNALYPYLKIEFFNKPHGAEEALPKSMMFNTDRKIGSIAKNGASGVIEISKELTVASLEKSFWEQFGLSVQVFRKSGKLWIETSLTDAWTLERQNEEGKEFSNPAPRQEEDLDLTDRDKWE